MTEKIQKTGSIPEIKSTSQKSLTKTLTLSNLFTREDKERLLPPGVHYPGQPLKSKISVVKVSGGYVDDKFSLQGSSSDNTNTYTVSGEFDSKTNAPTNIGTSIKRTESKIGCEVIGNRNLKENTTEVGASLSVDSENNNYKITIKKDIKNESTTEVGVSVGRENKIAINNDINKRLTTLTASYQGNNDKTYGASIQYDAVNKSTELKASLTIKDNLSYSVSGKCNESNNSTEVGIGLTYNF